MHFQIPAACRNPFLLKLLQAQKLSIGQSLLLIEGAGGWHAPISEREAMADLAHALVTPLLLVVGLPPGVPEPCAVDRTGHSP